jgi:hypothetical protein
MSSPFPFFMALYLIITAANPFVQPRYEYPIYVLLCFELARNEWTPGWFRARGWPRRWHPALASPPCTEEG